MLFDFQARFRYAKDIMTMRNSGRIVDARGTPNTQQLTKGMAP